MHDQRKPGQLSDIKTIRLLEYIILYSLEHYPGPYHVQTLPMMWVPFGRVVRKGKKIL